MILSDSKILQSIENKEIVIEPFDLKCLGSNSYDVHLGSTIGWYTDSILDSKIDNHLHIQDIPKSGIILYPGKLYLSVTEELTETHKHVPFLEGKSSTGRLGINIHSTAGKGDIGFCGFWTLEITVAIPVRVYKGMPIGQLIYHSIEGDVINPYNLKKSAKYSNQPNIPVGSKMFMNKF